MSEALTFSLTPDEEMVVDARVENLKGVNPTSAMVGLMKSWIYYTYAIRDKKSDELIEVPVLDTQFNEITPSEIPLLLLIGGVDYLDRALHLHQSPLLAELRGKSFIEAALDEIRADETNSDSIPCAAHYEGLLSELRQSQYYYGEAVSVSPWVNAGYGALIVGANNLEPENFRLSQLPTQLHQVFPPKGNDPTTEEARIRMFVQQKALSTLVSSFISR